MFNLDINNNILSIFWRQPGDVYQGQDFNSHVKKSIWESGGRRRLSEARQVKIKGAHTNMPSCMSKYSFIRENWNHEPFFWRTSRHFSVWSSYLYCTWHTSDRFQWPPDAHILFLTSEKLKYIKAILMICLWRWISWSRMQAVQLNFGMRFEISGPKRTLFRHRWRHKMFVTGVYTWTAWSIPGQPPDQECFQKIKYCL